MTRDELAESIRRREDVVTRVRKVLVEALAVRRELDEIDPDAPLFGTGLGLDSVDAVELVVSLETEFGIRFPQSTSAKRAMRTVGTVTDVVMFLMGASP